MGANTRSQVSKDRKNWDKIFNGLVKMLQSQQGQLESLVKERKFFEDRIKMQHDRWVSDIRTYEDYISQMKNELVGKEMEELLEDAKSTLLVGLKNKENAFCKLKLVHAEDELADFKAWFDFLTQIPKEPVEPCKETSGLKKGKIKAIDNMLESEVRRLRQENQKLASENKHEVSSLSRENKFAWEQLRRLESDLAEKLKSKDSELKQANDKISRLLSSMEQLESSNHQKDETIATLQTKVSEMEDDANNSKEVISRLSQELELLKKSRNTSVIPVLKCCTTEVSKQGGRKGRSGGGSNLVVKKNLFSASISDPAKGSGKENRGTKRKEVGCISRTSETPKLFTSNFKVPKLKIVSPSQHHVSAI